MNADTPRAHGTSSRLTPRPFAAKTGEGRRMKDTPKTSAPAATVLAVAVALLVPGFAVGVMIGRSTLERRAEGRAEPGAEPAVSGELAACQEELEAPSRAQAPASAPEAPREEPKRGAVGASAKVEELREAVRECKKNDLLTKAEVCIAAGRAFDMIVTSSPEEFRSCQELFFPRELIKDNFKKCVEIGDVTEDLKRDRLTEEEARRVLHAVKVREALDEETLVERITAAMDACSKKHPQKTY